MDIIRAYLDTSVLGGCFDRIFEKDSVALFQCIQNKDVIPLVSDIVIGEISRAPLRVQKILDSLISDGVEILPVSENAVFLQERYLNGNVLSRRWEEDALHVALATVARADVLVSWNFKHLVDPRRVRAFNGINITMGYGLISILPPSDIVRLIKDIK